MTASRKLAAIMLTDIVGYSAMMNNDETLALQMLEYSVNLQTSLVQKYDGQWIKEVGDGAFMLFESVVNAVRCGVEIQRMARQEEKLSYKIVIHSGEVILQNADLYGDDVNQTARLEQFAQSNSILISSKAALELKNIKSIDTVFLGRFSLKNIAEPVSLYGIAGNGLSVPDLTSIEEEMGEIESPSALRAKSPTVPVAMNEFIGREKELGDVLTLLQQTRLLTLTGSGGTGKTRLALELLRQFGDQIKEKVYYVQLAPVTSPLQVIAKVAQVTRLQQNPTKRTIESVVEFIGDDGVLLVMDNFEHVMEAVQDIATLLESCSNLKILVTSRMVLNVPGETEYAVPQLEIPAQDVTHQTDEISKFSSVSLFVNRGRSVLPKFELTADNVDSVVEICRRLDGLPLALELAAMRLKLFSPRALLKRLDRKLDILSSSSEAIPDRHKTLRSAIDWSYSLLQPEEQTLFRRLSVFSGGCTIEAAEDICFSGYEDQFDIVELLSSLVDKSLVYRQDQEDGEPRFHLLETLRTYGLEQLSKSLEIEQIEQKYIAYFKNWLEHAGSQLTGPDQGSWCDKIENDFDNVRSVLGKTAEQDLVDTGLEIAISFWRYWAIRTKMREGRDTLSHLLQLPIGQNKSIIRCRALNACGIMLGLTQKMPEGIAMLKESVQSACDLDYEEGQLTALNHLGWLYGITLNLPEARRCNKEARKLSLHMNNTRQLAASMQNEAWVERQAGNLYKAIELEENSAKMKMDIGDLRGYAFAISTEGYMRIYHGEYEKCESLNRKALVLARQIGDTQLAAWSEAVLAHNYYCQGHFEPCLELCNSAMQSAERTGNFIIVGLVLWIRAKVCLHQKQYPELVEIGQKLADGAIMSDYSYVFYSSILRAYATKYQGRFEEAARITQKNVSLLFEREALFFLPENLELLATIFFDLGQHKKSVQLLAWSKQFRDQNGIVVPKIEEPDLDQLVLNLQENIDSVSYHNLCVTAVQQEVVDLIADSVINHNK